ncbi:unnamed protein product [Didymodactylos carnosus]|uniref:DUF7796 domain-containing protein n=1 Tax=Didymodactylos carnosus TaxID=1234261 RepID=A0A816A150_9BILA|nr:unnamed protein product [Didymodactylos carnosus]CAF1591672.1 unnamed protein product [Didymodactylos carnosus]CAF4301153.1 unnamed protein product [Didymodactylos carnosus]CAF4464177.1 unnamed protein product [Didymodactylos carnosus]
MRLTPVSVQVFCAIVGCLFLFIFCLSAYRRTISYPTSFPKKLFAYPSHKVPLNCTTYGEKWIIITTIFYPTDAVRKFLSLSSDWKLMVIGDRKTPKDWVSNITQTLRSKLIFLSIDDQLKLDYRIIEFLPEGAYTRKNIGYLAAIQCGAKIIYESDDDNLLEADDIMVLPKQSTALDVPWYTFHQIRSPFINIYGSFGHPRIWPRGFPIDELKNVTEDGWSSLRQNENHEPVNAYIQQYLADLDPDVDAIYRLAHPMTLGHIRFNRDQKPVAVEPFTFSPYNTQNTVTHYEAFWGLYLPVTTTFRVCDIWRGFWVQRLLWDIGGSLVFGTSTVSQTRNAHNYIKDMDDEQQMYHESGKFARFLTQWSSSAQSLFERILELADDIVQAGYWKSNEVEIMSAWLEDLVRVNYKPPAISHNKAKTFNTEIRTAVCVTGVVECFNNPWNLTGVVESISSNDSKMDVFLYLSTNMTNKEKLRHVMQHNSTVKVFYEERYLDIAYSTSCKHVSRISERIVQSYFQQLWSLAKCYAMVKDYEKKMNLKYEILIRAAAGGVLTKLKQPFNISNRIVLPTDMHLKGVNDRFAIGPMNLMAHYMQRWNTLPSCHPKSLDSQDYLEHILSLYTNVILDKDLEYKIVCE